MSTSYFHLAITVDPEDYEEKVLDILSKAKPTWDRKNIDIVKNGKGLLNILLICHEKSESESTNNDTECDKIIVRVFGGNMGEMNRQEEIEIMKMVSEKGIVPKVYGSFQNGVVYGYAPGIVPTKDQLLDQNILTGEKLKQNLKNNTMNEWLEVFWTAINSSDLKPVVKDSRFKTHFVSLEHLEKLKSEVSAIYDELGVRYPPVFCHMDTHSNNIVYDSITDKISIIDWELCCMAPEVYDIAYLVDRDTDFNDKDALDNPEARGQWVRTYLSTHPQYKPEPITDELFQKWYKDSLRASMVNTLAMGMWGVFSVVHSAKDFDFFIAVKHQMDRFYRYRAELANME